MARCGLQAWSLSEPTSTLGNGNGSRLIGAKLRSASAQLALDVGRRHQQGAAYLVAHPALGLGRPQRHCHTTQAVRDQHHRPGLAADLGVQLGDPVGAQRVIQSCCSTREALGSARCQ